MNIDNMDYETQKKALYRLHHTIAEGGKPLIFWVGAGVSKWCYFPLWSELADNLHSLFLKTVDQYDKNRATNLLKNKEFPKFFELCQKTDTLQYNKTITETFLTKEISPIYQKLIDLFCCMQPLHILTTNVDEMLEKNVSCLNILQRENLEQCIPFIQREVSFICKLHGSGSNALSLVFTESEYDKLLADKSYMKLLQEIFSTCTVVFLGYSLSEEYIAKHLEESKEGRKIFGDGPHFVFTNNHNLTVPGNVLRVGYSTALYLDHRSVLMNLEAVKFALYKKENKRIETPLSSESSKDSDNRDSVYYLTDIIAPGTWQTSQSFDSMSVDGVNSVHTIVGLGFQTNEVPITKTSLHDLIVGLICFDKVYVRATSLDRIFALLGEDNLALFISNDCLRVLYISSQPAMMLEHKAAIFADIGLITKSSQQEEYKDTTQEEYIRDIFIPTAGNEKNATSFIDKVLQNTLTLSQEALAETPLLTRNILSYPHVRNLLGISYGVSTVQIPRWNLFSVQRLAYSVQDSLICKEIKASACKAVFGGEQLLGTIFSIATADEKADSVAGYVIAGDLNVDLGKIFLATPSLLKTILKFRDTESGIKFRKVIQQQLAGGNGTELTSSINAGLKQQISTNVLQDSRKQFQKLLLSEEISFPSIMADCAYDDSYIENWKISSKKQLDDYCKKHNISAYDLCPCGSGDKLKFCCDESLKI